MSNKRIGDGSTSSNRPEKALKSWGPIDTEIQHGWRAKGVPFLDPYAYRSRKDHLIEEEIDSFCELSEEVVSNLCEGVVILASYEGNDLNCSCSGMIVANDLSGMDILTSADLLRSPSEPNGMARRLTILVFVSNMECPGHLRRYHLDSNIALIRTSFFPGIKEAFFGRLCQLSPRSKVLAVGRNFMTGNLVATRGTVSNVQTGQHMRCSCRITKSMLGGPLIDFHGNFFGISSFKRSRVNPLDVPFLPWNKIRESLGNGIWDAIEQDTTMDKSTAVIETPTLPNLENHTFEEEFGSSSDSCQGAWSELSKEVVSNLSKSVVSLASFKGDRLNCACTGMVVTRNSAGLDILTSADLFRCPHDPNEIHCRMRILVHLPNRQEVVGRLKAYDFDYNVALVRTGYIPGIKEAFLGHKLKFVPQGKVVAVGRGFNSCKLMATTGAVIDEQTDKYMRSTCKITKSGIGGPLIDLDGNFVGINLYSLEGNSFLPRDKIHNPLKAIWDAIEEDRIFDYRPRVIVIPINPLWGGFASSKIQKKYQKRSRSSQRVPKEEYTEYVRDIKTLPDFRPLPDDEFTRSFIKKLKMNGYPEPITLEGGMRLLYGFEEEFSGDIPDDLPLNVVSHASRCVVSLASFYDGKRVFVCTGVFIASDGSNMRILTSASLVRISADSNKIYDNLEIQVCLPNNQRIQGKLQQYNLNYNIAVVSITCFRCCRVAKYNADLKVKPYREVVVAIGRVFQTGKLMATDGVVTRRRTKHCPELKVSTCKITKAGIGGPLIGFHGDFIGMNFYDIEQTPYLPADRILMLLREFDDKGIFGRTDAEKFVHPNDKYSWPLPEPIWHYPSSVVRCYETRRRYQ